MGHLRFVLAILVVFSHLAANAGSVGYLAHIGVFAVFGFYLLSGFLITRILNETYQFNFYKFALNRFLRIYPIYYIVALFSLVIIIFVPSSNSFHPAWVAQYGVVDLLGNVLIFPFEFYGAQFRLSPPTWSVAVELVSYFILWLVTGRSKKVALAMSLAAFAYHIISLGSGQDWTKRYYPSYAALLPFSLGSVIYFFREEISKISQNMLQVCTIVSLVLWVGNMIICGYISSPGGRYFDAHFYVNLLFLLILVSLLSSPKMSGLFQQSGKALGDMAYPIFLTHWIVGFIMSRLLFEDNKYGSFGLTLVVVSLPPILAISFFLARIADRVVEPLRNRVRGRVVVS